MEQNKEKFIPIIINSLMNKKKIPLYGNGKNIREWIYVEDFVSAIEFLIKHEDIWTKWVSSDAAKKIKKSLQLTFNYEPI